MQPTIPIERSFYHAQTTNHRGRHEYRQKLKSQFP